MNYTRYIGWDVHAETIVMAEALPGRDPVRDLGSIPNTTEAVRNWLRKQPDASALDIAFEAGPTGLGLARLCQSPSVSPVLNVWPSFMQHSEVAPRQDRRQCERR